MSFNTAAIVAVAVLVAVALIGYLVRAWRVWREYRSERVVTCPETGYAASVRIDTAHAAITELTAGAPELRLAACSRWDVRGPCDEPCIYEAQDPESRVSVIAARWYDGKVCLYCRAPLDEDRVAGHHAAFLDSSGETREWSDVPPEALPDALRTGWPVCWNCHVVSTFRRRYPQMVTDRTDVTRPS